MTHYRFDRRVESSTGTNPRQPTVKSLCNSVFAHAPFIPCTKSKLQWNPCITFVTKMRVANGGLVTNWHNLRPLCDPKCRLKTGGVGHNPTEPIPPRCSRRQQIARPGNAAAATMKTVTNAQPSRALTTRHHASIDRKHAGSSRRRDDVCGVRVPRRRGAALR